MSNPILAFDGDYRFLSNFYTTNVSLDGCWYPTVENAFQAAKTMNFQERFVFQNPAMFPGAAKKLGRKLTLSPDWEERKLYVMEKLLRQKFSKHELTHKLIDTAPSELIEGNYWHDNYWGSCFCKACDDCGYKFNYLGKLLMKIRDEYMAKHP